MYLRTSEKNDGEIPKTGEGFTLIELLVVIAILGILASLLLPALAKSKSRALQVQCLGQTKQLALALQMYTHDNKDWMPWPNWGNKLQGWLYTPVNDDPPKLIGRPEEVYAGGMLWPYVKAVKVYWCPLDYTNTQYFAKRKEKLSSYIMNGGIMGYHRRPSYARTHRLTDMKPSAYVTWEPSDNPPYDAARVFNDGASYPTFDEGPSRRHTSGCNVSSFDGHAEYLKFVTFVQEGSQKPGLLWCDPDTEDGMGDSHERRCSLWK